MSKNTGPYFEFVLTQNGPRYEFIFNRGNASLEVFNATIEGLTAAFKNSYGISAPDYIRETINEEGLKTIAIYQTKIATVFKAILGNRAFNDFKLRITGLDKDGNEKTVVVSTQVEALKALEVVPYFNRNNNDMTTRRRK